MTEVKYRIGFEAEASFTPDNSVIREAKGEIAITYRGQQDLPISGNMQLVPFCFFNIGFHLEFSHFELDEPVT